MSREASLESVTLNPGREEWNLPELTAFLAFLTPPLLFLIT